jgi:hypothetical protein
MAHVEQWHHLKMEKQILTELRESFAKESTVFTHVMHGVCNIGFCVSAGFVICGRLCFGIQTVDVATGKAFVTIGSDIPWLVATAVAFCVDIFLVYSIGVSPEVGEGDFFFLGTDLLSNCGCDLSAISIELTEILGISGAKELGASFGSACCCVEA